VKAAPRARSKNDAAFIIGRFDHSNSKNLLVIYQKAIEKHMYLLEEATRKGRYDIYWKSNINGHSPGYRMVRKN
jgi:hypothetical protein